MALDVFLIILLLVELMVACTGAFWPITFCHPWLVSQLYEFWEVFLKCILNIGLNHPFRNFNSKIVKALSYRKKEYEGWCRPDNLQMPWRVFLSLLRARCLTVGSSSVDGSQYSHGFPAVCPRAFCSRFLCSICGPQKCAFSYPTICSMSQLSQSLWQTGLDAFYSSILLINNTCFTIAQ